MARGPVSLRRHLVGLAVLLAILFGVAGMQMIAVNRFRHAQACKQQNLMWDEQTQGCIALPVQNANR